MIYKIKKNLKKKITISPSRFKYDSLIYISKLFFKGERVDFVLDTNQANNQNYWIKVKGYEDCESLEIYQTAILEYKESNGLPQENLSYNNSGSNLHYKVGFFCKGFKLNN